MKSSVFGHKICSRAPRAGTAGAGPPTPGLAAGTPQLFWVDTTVLQKVIHHHNDSGLSGRIWSIQLQGVGTWPWVLIV